MGSRSRCEIDDHVAWITLDDGKVNALSAEMIGEIEEALDAAEAAGAVVVLRGREGMFSAGFDLKTFERGPREGIEMVRAGAELVLRLLAHPQPVLTVCNGHAYPAGAFLMLAADVRLGARGPWRIGLNEVAIGMTVPRFALELAAHRLTPPGRALVATACMWSPDEALQLGYLDRVVEAEQLAMAAEKEASRLRALDAPSFTATKARLNARSIEAIRSAVHEELAAVKAREEPA